MNYEEEYNKLMSKRLKMGDSVEGVYHVKYQSWEKNYFGYLDDVSLMFLLHNLQGKKIKIIVEGKL